MVVRGKVIAGVLIATFFAGSTIAFAGGDTRIPAGHSYSPSKQSLPQLNSRQDRINSRADIYESEIYRSKRDAAIRYSNMGIFGRDRLMQGGSTNRPRY